MSDSTLDDLKRRAFSSDNEDAIAARQQLAELERAQLAEQAEEPPEQDVPALPRFTSTPWWAAALIGAASLAAIATGIATTLTPTSPLPVFDRPQTALDAAPLPLEEGEYVPGSSRWLASSLDVKVFGFLQEPEKICVAADDGATSRWNCATYEEFAKVGLSFTMSQPRDGMVGILSVHWTPDGTLSTDWVEFQP